MSREIHVRFCESAEGKFLRATRLPLNRGKNFVKDFRLVLYKTFSETWQTSCKHDVI
jgi:hypothetical protein